MAVIPLGKSFANWFAGQAEYPTFKKTGRHAQLSFTKDRFTKGRKAQIAQVGWVRMHEALLCVGEVLGGTISRTAD